MPYARSTGARRTPIIRGTVVSMRRMVLKKGPLQGRAHSANRTTETRHASITLVTCSCPQRSRSFKNQTRNSGMQTKSTSPIVTATATTPIHHEVMVPEALGNLGINCMKHNKTNTRFNTYPSPNIATDKVDSIVNSTLINENIRVLWSNKGLKILTTMILCTN